MGLDRMRLRVASIALYRTSMLLVHSDSSSEQSRDEHCCPSNGDCDCPTNSHSLRHAAGPCIRPCHEHPEIDEVRKPSSIFKWQ